MDSLANQRDNRDIVTDALFWFIVSAALLLSLRVGFVSGDALAHSASFARGDWSWNPNHLLIEPISAWWHAFTLEVGLERSGPDRLKLLSALAGALTVGIFRAGPAAEVTSSRSAANYGTAWVAGASAFQRLWISGETHMLQMPALTLAAWGFILFLREPQWRWSLMTGGAVAVASLFYISNALLAATLPVACLGRGRRVVRRSTGILVVAAAGTATGLAAAWRLLSPGAGFFEWTLSYAGGAVSDAVSDAYGTTLTFSGLATATARAAYGSASAMVDLAPLVEWLRSPAGEGLGFFALLSAVAVALFVVLGLSVRRASEEGEKGGIALRTVVGFAAAVVLFGVYWNNSDDQFYFQLALPVAVLMVVAPPWRWRFRAAVGAAVVGVFLWNVGDLHTQYISYPRHERVEMLGTALAGADLVVYPGQDEVGHLLYFVDAVESREKVALTAVAARLTGDEGLAEVHDRVRQVLNAGGSVALVNVLSADYPRQPWHALTRRGYSPEAVEAVLGSIPSTGRVTVGPFVIETLVGPGHQPPPD